jgi:peptidoglycan/xylan/chitin deacetylase (PgdA/CDA1 family)
MPTRRRLLVTLAAAAAVLPLAGWTSPSPPVPKPLKLPRLLPARTVVAPILMYHRIAPYSSRLTAMTNALTVSPEQFAAEMRWLHAAGFHAVSQAQLFDALERGARLPRRPIVITFDDGYRDVLWNAAPVLHRLHMPATAYVITSRISGPDSSFLTWDELGSLEKLGFDIGSHTVDHLELPYLSQAQAWHQLIASRRALEQHLGHPVQWFSYPAGAEDPAVLPLVRRAGYVLAVTTHYGEVQSAQHPFELKRYEVLDTTGVGGLRALLLHSGA